MNRLERDIALAEQAPQEHVETEPSGNVSDNSPGKQKRTRRPRVVIVGSGFGGINATKALAGKEVDVTLIDRNNYHGFWPLLYQVATAGLEAAVLIAYPVRAIFRKYRNITFHMENVESIDLDKRLVKTESHRVPYDYLILAAGSANNYFGNDALAHETYGLKDIDEAEKLRNNLLCSFEQAASESDPEKRRTLMTFVIVGGGPTGVELSGAFSELIHQVLRKDYPMLDTAEARVILIEATDKILASFPDSLQNAAKRKLAQMDIELKLNAPVQSVDDGLVTLKDGAQIKASLVVWAAGVRASMLTDALHMELGRNSRAKVTPNLNIEEHPEVFIVGDMAYLEGYKGNQSYPMVAPVAIQQGKRAALNILAQVRHRPMRPFHYFDKGNLATIGRRSAVMDAFGLRLSGRLAWLGWLFVHIFYLIGFRNRLIVLINWAINYFTYDRGVRLITGKE